MNTGWLALAILGLLYFNGVSSKQNSYDPMVAFVCDKGAMHMDPNEGWYQDPHTDCIEDKEKILAYCRQVYPSLDVRNIVETLDHAVIKGWCPLGEAHCTFPQKYTVRPYRCLIGPFQSDALIVPHGCVFDHVHDNGQCQSHDWWGEKALQSCRELHQMDASSFAMLLPCGTDLFTGVEFVCCPPDGVSSEKIDVRQPKIEVKVSSSATEDNSDKVLQSYMRMTSEALDNEHEAYELAKSRLLKQSHDKINKLMKQWSEARNSVQDMKSRAGDKAGKLTSELTERYQKEYARLQVEMDSKTLQLDAVHQQHVQANFNNKKKKTMQKLMQQLQAAFYDVDQIVSLLQKYISIEEKDANHCMKHLLKIKATDPQAAADLLPATLEHLSLISLRINQSVDLLDTVRDEVVVNKMKTSIRSWLEKKYFSVDKLISQLKSLTYTPKPVTMTMPTTASKKQDVDLSKSSKEPMNMYAKYAQKLKSLADGKDLSVLEESGKDEIQSVDRVLPGVDDLKFSSIDVKQHRLSKKPVVHSVSQSVVIAITCSLSVAACLVLVVIMLVRTRSRRSSGSRSNAYLKVSADMPDMTPEDRHVAAMQNGYENPTYKLLEQRKA